MNMPYRVNKMTGTIHDASKPHAQKIPSDKYVDRITVSEAKAEAVRNGCIPHACIKCQFSSAIQEEINLQIKNGGNR